MQLTIIASLAFAAVASAASDCTAQTSSYPSFDECNARCASSDTGLGLCHEDSKGNGWFCCPSETNCFPFAIPDEKLCAEQCRGDCTDAGRGFWECEWCPEDLPGTKTTNVAKPTGTATST